MLSRWLATLQITILVFFGTLSADLTGTSAHPSSGGDHVWKLYTNVRFEYAICYPEDLLVPQGESPNSDGQKFVAKDGAQLIVFGQNNALDQSLKDALADTQSRLASPPSKLTYKALTPRGFAISGQNAETVFYARTLYSHDQFKSFELTYNKSMAAIYKPLIERLTTCFVDLGR